MLLIKLAVSHSNNKSHQELQPFNLFVFRSYLVFVFQFLQLNETGENADVPACTASLNGENEAVDSAILILQELVEVDVVVVYAVWSSTFGWSNSALKRRFASRSRRSLARLF